MKLAGAPKSKSKRKRKLRVTERPQFRCGDVMAHALALFNADTGSSISKTMNKALRQFLPAEYIAKAQEMLQGSTKVAAILVVALSISFMIAHNRTRTEPSIPFDGPTCSTTNVAPEIPYGIPVPAEQVFATPAPSPVKIVRRKRTTHRRIRRKEKNVIVAFWQDFKRVNPLLFDSKKRSKHL